MPDLENTVLTEPRKRHGFFRCIIPCLAVGLIGLIGGCGDSKHKVSYLSNNDIYVMNTDGSNRRNITNTPEQEEVYMSWSPDGRKVVFNIRGSPNLFILDRATSDSRAIERYGIFDILPSISPDGKKLAFSARGGGFPICIRNMEDYDSTQSVKELEEINVADYPIKWSSDGRKIAFLENSGACICHIVDTDGKSLGEYPKYADRMYGDKILTAHSFCWSPDSERIAISARCEDRRFILSIANLDFSNIRKLLEGEGVYNPSWSPDGSKIVFELDDAVCAIGENGKGFMKLTESYEDAGRLSPKWSPNGRKILFKRGNDIFIMNANGSNIRNITNTPNEDKTSISWVSKF